MRKKVFLMGSLLALVILLGATHAYAQSPASSKHAHGWNDSMMAQVATKLNLSSSDIANMKSEVASGVSIKQVLSQYGITMDQVRTALGTVSSLENNRASNTQIAAIAAKLGINAADIQTDIASGKNLQQIMTEYNITQSQLESAIASMHHGVSQIKKS